MSNNTTPIFFDESRKRGEMLQRLATLISFIVIGAALALLVNILRTPNVPINPIPSTVVRAPHQPGKSPHRSRSTQEPKDRFELKAVLRNNERLQTTKQKLAAQIARDASIAAIPAAAIAPGHVAGPVRAAFYLNSDKPSLDSLLAHIGQTTHLMPVWLTLAAKPGDLTVVQELSSRENSAIGDEEGLGKTNDDQAIAAARKAGVAIIPVLQNYDNAPAVDKFRDDWLHNLLASPANRASVIAKTLKFVLDGGYQGINIDFESDNEADQAGMTAFMMEIAVAFHPHHLIVTQDIQTDSGAYNLPALAEVNDFVIPMLYDEHATGTVAGPIASQGWYESELDTFMKDIPANKVVLGLGSYGYDWMDQSTNPDEVSFEEAVQTAQESKDGEDGVIRIDGTSLNPSFTYWDDDNGVSSAPRRHQVWLMDATTVYNQVRYADKYHTLGSAMWRLGTEDPSVWSFLGKQYRQPVAAFNAARLNEVSFDYFGTQFEGAGDVLRVVRTPSDGRRVVTVNPASGYVTAEDFKSYPSQYVIRRTGLVDQKTEDNTRKIAALTFDDGPDPRWTPQILDILKREGVPATFFVVGQNAEAYPGLVAREWREGMEIGNHSYTHPENFNVSPLRTKLELDTTQRVIEAIIGHETTLFRAPNIADSEPSTQRDLSPVLDAQRLGYTFIGEVVDPTDWVPGVTSSTIVNRVLADAHRGNAILLHDAGGDTRQATIDALPKLIEGLKAQGYTFVTVSTLMNRPKDLVFPEVPANQRLEVAFDRFMFQVTNWSGKLMNALFIGAILLGIGRVLFLGFLAVRQSKREAARDFRPGFAPPVTVIIAAYNEAKVINKTIDTLLASDYPDLDIMVVDDGSKDDTAGVVAARFGDNPKVKVIRKENGGKASALNVGIKECRGEIVVALDADTVFAPDTVSNLVRHFGDSRIGAVSGNVKVGNRNNPLTIWQAVEYITSQNFDRRAFDLLNCITVVPGAVGAWRKDAVILAGLYSSETLAEDTDLTFKVRRLGYKIVTDNSALAFTEAPDTLRDLAKQRYRWAFGTLQCLWKHRTAMFNPRYGAFGIVALPSLWIYQIGFQVMAPIVDVSILWTFLYGWFVAPALGHSALMNVIAYWGLFSAVDLIGAWIAFDLDNEDKTLLGWLLLQRFVYRQLMYYVVVKSIFSALRGSLVGWGKLDRKGTVNAAQAGRVGLPLAGTDKPVNPAVTDPAHHK
ncbi:MAG TPA: glycosyltransferase [Capsulimonadaceae bacterium]|jgi:cellulose synthase/poly-beta-1,6-N-acetylglucosamine synthase-like glycosyltransferase/peptidoglycan/xylan/chitin deacetylase (PgdA/CDA1 family)/spore germination protein YaaH